MLDNFMSLYMLALGTISKIVFNEGLDLENPSTVVSVRWIELGKNPPTLLLTLTG
jgi:hypothetical protein